MMMMRKTEIKRCWEPAHLHLQVGDIITSKKGILAKGWSNKHQCVYKMKYLGGDRWMILGERREFVEAKPMKKW
jgi:hypothetical protein